MAYIYPFHGQWPDIDPGAYLADNVTVVGKVTIKKGANLWPGVVVRGDDNEIIIGKGVNIQDNTMIHVDPGDPLVLDDYCMVGHSAVIHCKHIGSGTLIGMGAILLANADIGAECIIGAGTMITQNKVIQPRSMVYGTPFRFVRSLRQEEVDAVRQDILEYEALGQEYKAMQKTRQQKK